MTDEADSSVVLAELQVALFRECNCSQNILRMFSESLLAKDLILYSYKALYLLLI